MRARVGAFQTFAKGRARQVSAVCRRDFPLASRPMYADVAIELGNSMRMHIPMRMHSASLCTCPHALLDAC